MNATIRSDILVLIGLVVGTSLSLFMREFSGALNSILKESDPSQYYGQVVGFQLIGICLYLRGIVRDLPAFLMTVLAGVLPFFVTVSLDYYMDQKRNLSDFEITTMVALSGVSLVMFFILKVFVRPRRRFKPKFVAKDHGMPSQITKKTKGRKNSNTNKSGKGEGSNDFR